MQNGGTLNMHPPQLCSPWPILPSLTQYKTAISVPLILMALLCWLSLQPEAMTSRNGCTEQKNSQQQQHIRPGMSTLPSIATSIPSGLFFQARTHRSAVPASLRWMPLRPSAPAHLPGSNREELPALKMDPPAWPIASGQGGSLWISDFRISLLSLRFFP